MIIRTMGANQKEAKVIDLKKKPNSLMHYTVEYDSMHPEQTLRDFIANTKSMVAKFEYNQNRLAEIELEMQDLLHYIEISSYKNVPDGYKMYRKMAELRRERRACKSENDLLLPIYEHFHATEVLKKMSLVQGECAKAKDAIDSRMYSVKTDVLDAWLEPENKETTVDIIENDEEVVYDAK